MAFCEFCKAEGQKTGTCAYCGTVYYTAGVTFIYGQTEKDSYSSEIRLTNKYLIVRSVSKAEMVGNIAAASAVGLIGGLAATAVDSARKKSYGFYDLQDLQKVIYPYHTNSLKKDTAFKFINRDGSDFVLNFNLNGMFNGNAANNFAGALVKVGVFLENGAESKYPFYCMNPFVNQATFATRVCQSAAAFVKMTDEQFIAYPISGGTQTNQAQTALQDYSQPVQLAPVVETIPTPAVNASAWQTPPVPVEDKKTEQVMCSTCGSMNSNVARFCSKCGTPFASNQQSACGTRFAAQNNAQTNYSPQSNNQSDYTQQPYNYGMNHPQYQQPVVAPQTQPKKKNAGMIIGIVAAIIVLAVIGRVAQEVFRDLGYGNGDGNDYTSSYNFGQNDSSSDDDTNSTTDNNVSDVKTYNKGAVVDGWYVNEWANMRFDTNGSWTDGSVEEYGAYEEDPNTECGIILNEADNGKRLDICFEKLNGPSAFITEEGYLDIITSKLEQQYTDAGITCAVDDYFDTTIAGEKFKTVKFTFDGSTMIQAFHVRKYDGYIIAVVVMAQDDFDASSIANNIQTID